jgi:hypothetical protein
VTNWIDQAGAADLARFRSGPEHDWKPGDDSPREPFENPSEALTPEERRRALSALLSAVEDAS